MTRAGGRETRCACDGSDYFGRKSGGRGASMIVGRLIGWVAFLAGAAVLVRDVLVWIYTKHWGPIALGQLWFSLDRSSLNLAQAVVQRYPPLSLGPDHRQHPVVLGLCGPDDSGGAAPRRISKARAALLLTAWVRRHPS